MNFLAPSIGCADLLHLEQNIQSLDRVGVRWFHMDIMDGTFVPNFCLGTDLIKAVRTISNTPIYTHLMAVNPENHIELLKSCGSDYLAFHFETTHTPYRLAGKIRASGMLPAVAINAITPVSAIEPLLDVVSCITLMTIEPGIVGPAFMDSAYEKIEALASLKVRKSSRTLIEVDGGVRNDNAKRCMDCGADVLVGGIHGMFKRNAGSIESQCNDFFKAVMSSN